MKFKEENSITELAKPEGLVKKSPGLLSLWYNPVTQLGHIRSERWKIRQRFEKTTRNLPIYHLFFGLGLVWLFALIQFAMFFTTTVRDGIEDWRVYGTPQFYHTMTGPGIIFYKTSLLYPFVIFPLLFMALAFIPLFGIIIGRNPLKIKALTNASEPDVLLTTTMADNDIFNGLLYSPFLTFHKLFSSALIFAATVIVGLFLHAILGFIPLSAATNFTLGIFGGIWFYLVDYVLLVSIGLLAGIMFAQVASITAIKWSVFASAMTSIFLVPAWVLLTRTIAIELVHLAVPTFRDPFVHLATFYSGLPILEFVILWFAMMLLAVWGLGKLGPWMFSHARRANLVF